MEAVKQKMAELLKALIKEDFQHCFDQWKKLIICEDATPCSSRLTCGACLASHNCAWCSDKIYQRGAPRCDKIDNLLERGCSKENIFSPGTISEILENEPLSDAGAVAGSAIQLKPQKLKLSLRPGM
ncbi:integrin beta [Trichonephila clavipes]|nr:integrin beta [Trichonephila clavipes]